MHLLNIQIATHAFREDNFRADLLPIFSDGGYEDYYYRAIGTNSQIPFPEGDLMARRIDVYLSLQGIFEMNSIYFRRCLFIQHPITREVKALAEYSRAQQAYYQMGKNLVKPLYTSWEALRWFATMDEPTALSKLIGTILKILALPAIVALFVISSMTAVSGLIIVGLMPKGNYDYLPLN